MSRVALLATLLCWSVASTAWGDTANSQQFTTDAATAGKAEVALGKLAMQKSTNPAVKRFAKQMVADHTKANTKLQAIAKREKLSVPANLTADQKAAADKLRSQSGAAFDRAYATQMVDDHEKVANLLRNAADDKNLDGQLREFARTTLPTVEHHLAEAKSLNDHVASAGNR